MMWTVLEENPWPDKYIPVFVGLQEDIKKMVENLGSYRNFREESEAISYAVHLGQRYDVEALRIFYTDGHSEKIRL